MHKKNLLLYPFSKELMPIVRFRHMLKDYTIYKTVAPRSLLQPDEDLSCLDGGTVLNITSSNEYKEELSHTDSILIDKGKEISPDILKDLVEECSNQNKEILYINDNPKIKPVKEEMEALKMLYDIDIPVVMVMGLGENCNKFEIQLTLRNHFENSGYKVSQIGTKEFSNIFGFHPMPDFISDDSISSENKIYLFNRYVKDLVNREDSDLIIIGVPGSIMKFNNKVTNSFGTTAFVISNAVKPDIGILSVYYDEFDKEYLKKLKKYCYYKFDCDIEYINIANVKLVSQMENFKKPIDYLTVDNKEILSFIEKMEEEELYLFNVMDGKNGNNFSNHIEERLTNNIVFI